MIKIVKWNETFENADSRKRQRLGFFYAPSGCDSSGYLTLMSEFPQKDALLALGVFMALCQQSATMKKGVRGTFLKGCGQPMNEKQICMLIHVDACHLRAALKVLTDSRVKWVEMIADKDGMPLICQSSASDVPQNSGFVQGEGEGEGEGEGKVIHVDLAEPNTTPSPDIVLTGLAKAESKHGVCPYKQIVDLYNEMLGATDLPICKIATDSRKAALRRTWAFFKYDAEAFRGYFKQVKESDFLCSRGKNNFQATFDWLLKQQNIIKVLEGNYNNG